jgi:hypothetical protein
VDVAAESPAQAVPADDRADIRESRRIQWGRQLERPAEQQPDAADLAGGVGQRASQAAGGPGAVGDGHEGPAPQVGADPLRRRQLLVGELVGTRATWGHGCQLAM